MKKVLSVYVLCLCLNPNKCLSQFPFTLPAGFSSELVFRGGQDAVSIAFDPDGNILVADKNGNILLFRDCVLNTLIEIPVDVMGERGLLGIALDPEYSHNKYVYVYYTVAGEGHNRVSRFPYLDDPIQPEQEEILLELDNLTETPFHNGGALAFGPDGKLFITTGDGAMREKAQSHQSLLGKILRLNPDGSIPTDNPFYSTNSGVYKSIYALGLRNPFTFSFSDNGKLYANDVGESTWEEINEIHPGMNYGWPLVEGKASENPDIQVPDNYVDPLYVYGHDVGCSITGAAFSGHSNTQFPEEYRGKYFFGDFCTPSITMFDPVTHEVSPFLTHRQAIHIAFNDKGEMFYIVFPGGNGGELWKISYLQEGPPVVTANPDTLIVSVGEAAGFRIEATGQAPLTFQWLRNGVEIPGATSSSFTLEGTIVEDNGDTFFCRVTNQEGTVASDTALLIVTERTRPVVNIEVMDGTEPYTAGDTIVVKGSAFDDVDGNLPASGLQWRIDFHHNFHFHPVISELHDADSIGIAVPRFGETSANVWYRIHLTAVNSIDLATSSFIDVHPKTAEITVTSNIENPITVLLDGTPEMTPYIFEAVAGMTRNLTTLPYHYQNEQLYAFDNWSGTSPDLSQTFNVFENDTTLVANYLEMPWGEGTGLTGRYYNDPNASVRVVDLERTDGPLDFDWTGQSPSPEITADTFGVTWEGYIKVPASANYSFHTETDGGIAVSIADTLIVNEAENNALQEFEGSVYLEGGMLYPVTITFSNRLQGIAKFSWNCPGVFPKMIVPREALYDLSNKPTALLTNEAPQLFALGDTLFASGEAMDSEGVPIPQDNFTWTIYLAGPDTAIALNKTQGVDSLYYPIPDSLNYIAGSWIVIRLEARDSGGFPASATRKLDPILRTVHIESETDGIALNLNHESLSSPQDITVIQGFNVLLEVVDTFFIREKVMYLYSDWAANDPINFHVSGDTTILLNYMEIPLNNGTGLTGEYFSGDMEGGQTPDSVRIDPQLDIQFDNLASALTINWSGFIVPPIDGNYVLKLAAMDGAQLKFEAITYPTDNGAVSTDAISLKKERLYPVEINYETPGPKGRINFSWMSDSFPEHTIPMYQLYPELVTGEEASNAGGLRIYPNPTSDFVNIQLPEGNRFNELTLINPLGQLLFFHAIDISAEALLLDLRGYRNGLYILQLSGSEGFRTFKVLKY
jgi:glucose/arabinose dehydrogenase